MFVKKAEQNGKDEGTEAPANGDVSFEPEEELADIGALQQKLKKLKLELANCKAERAQFLDGWQRCKADSINARRESFEQARREKERAKETIIEDIIPALDSFDMARQGEAWQKVDVSWRGGIERVQDLLIDALKRNGIERFGKAGDKYDDELHESLGEEEDAGADAGAVVRVVRHGYKTADRVLRPAHVTIAR